MASTNKTPHLGLNQWVLDDPFLMEDCNADNRKIDTAMQALQGKMELVKLKTATAAVVPIGTVRQVDVQVQDINFSEWQCVILDVHVSENCEMRVNGTESGLYATIGSMSWIQKALARANGKVRIIFITNLNPDATIQVITFYEGLQYGYANIKYADLKVLNFVSYYPFYGDCKFTFWGVK